MRPLPAAVAFCAALVPAGRAAAGACCMSASAIDVGRLRMEESLAAGLRTTVSSELGQWSEDWDWEAHDEDSGVVVWRSEAWVLARVTDRLSVSGRLPALVTRRSWQEYVPDSGGAAGYRPATDSGGGLADAQLGVRWGLPPVTPWPLVALSFGATVPTGTSISALPRSVMASDATARGVWALGASLSLEKVLLPWFVRLSAGGAVPLTERAATATHHRTRFGLGWNASLAAGRELVDGLVVSAAAAVAGERALSYDGRVVPDSWRLEPTVTAALSWRLGEAWSLQGAASGAPLLDGFGHTAFGRVSGTLGVRYGWT